MDFMLPLMPYSCQLKNTLQTKTTHMKAPVQIYCAGGKKQENVHQQWQRIGSVKITRSEAGVCACVFVFVCK